MYAVIRLRGIPKKRKEIEYTLKLLRLNRKMHCVLLEDRPEITNMIKKVKDFVTWGEISDEVLKKLIAKRGRKQGNKRLTEEEAKKIFNEIKSGKKIKELNIKPVFRLTPPSKGFKKSIKQAFPNGELGYRGEKINELLERMI